MCYKCPCVVEDTDNSERSVHSLYGLEEEAEGEVVAVLESRSESLG